MKTSSVIRALSQFGAHPGMLRVFAACSSEVSRPSTEGSNAGEAKLLTVRPRANESFGSAAAPTASQDVPMMDFAYGGVERWPAGSHTLRVENRGKQDHQMLIAKLRDGASMKDWMNAEDPGKLATPVSGVARMGPGTVAYLPVELAPGGYVLFCLVSDAASGKMHLELGMFRHVQVD